jgi:hypothetical protein
MFHVKEFQNKHDRYPLCASQKEISDLRNDNPDNEKIKAVCDSAEMYFLLDSEVRSLRHKLSSFLRV